MTTDKIRINIENHIARVTLTQPEKHNAFDDSVIADLTDAFDLVTEDPNIRVLVLSGEGKSFSAGADLEWMRRMSDYDEIENLTDAKSMANMLKTLNDCPKPTIARVHGAAYGGGVGLVACCDMALATENTKFCFSETKLGLAPSTISPYVINAISEKNARRFFLTAEVFDSYTAKEIGLINMVTNNNQIDIEIDGLINNLLENGPMAIAACKELINEVGRGKPKQSIIDYTANHIAKLRASDEGIEGLNAFLQKRKPIWKNKK
jgi:methylglutaconyl-CoA hydratase